MNAIMRWSPFEALTLADPFDVDSFVRDVWESWEPTIFRGDFGLGLDMYEDKDDLVIKTELPGVKKEDFEITLEEGTLTIKAEKKREDTSEDAKHYAQGRYYGEYSRCVELPYAVDADKVSAHLEDGVLEIRLPKAEEAKAKHIEIK